MDAYDEMRAAMEGDNPDDHPIFVLRHYRLPPFSDPRISEAITDKDQARFDEPEAIIQSTFDPLSGTNMHTNEAYIFDTETTGMDKPIIMVESALLPVVFHKGLPFGVGEPTVERWAPGKPIEFGAMATHHITDEDVYDCRPHEEFHLPDGMKYMVGHNIDYDWEVAGKPEVKRIDTLALARKLWPGVSHKLGALLYMLDRDAARVLCVGAHSAGVDVEINCIVLRHIVMKLGQSLTWETLWEISEEARIPVEMSFGKHKGVKLTELPSDYVRWALKNLTDDPYLTKALRAL